MIGSGSDEDDIIEKAEFRRSRAIAGEKGETTVTMTSEAEVCDHVFPGQCFLLCRRCFTISTGDTRR